MKTATKADIDLHQGYDAKDRPFGYVHGDDGGFYFTWMPTIDETLESVEEDAQDGGGGLDRDDVIDLLRDHLPNTTRGNDHWDLGDSEDLYGSK